MILAVGKDDVKRAKKTLDKLQEPSFTIGEVMEPEGEERVVYE